MMNKSLPLLALCAVAAFALPARAEFQVRSPTVDYQEIEIEHNGSVTFDRGGSDKNHKQSYTTEIGYGVTPWWKLAVEGEWGADADQRTRYQATTLESVFQLTPQGKYWADVGLFVEYSRSNRRGNPDTVEFGPIVQKETDGFFDSNLLHTANLFVEREVGHNHGDSTAFEYAWQSRLRLNQYFEPGAEFYGTVGKIDRPGKFTDQEHRFGPMFAGGFRLSPGWGELKYELGYLFAMTQATENNAVRWKLEYELPF
ncbi:MAG: hypothetical protein ACM30I_12240 [Gemmatimonas sp.]